MALWAFEHILSDLGLLEPSAEKALAEELSEIDPSDSVSDLDADFICSRALIAEGRISLDI